MLKRSTFSTVLWNIIEFQFILTAVNALFQCVKKNELIVMNSAEDYENHRIFCRFLMLKSGFHYKIQLDET